MQNYGKILLMFFQCRISFFLIYITKVKIQFGHGGHKHINVINSIVITLNNNYNKQILFIETQLCKRSTNMVIYFKLKECKDH